MGIISIIHIVCGLLALAFGGGVLLLPKGTKLHRLVGYLYILNMLGLNLTALMIYRVFKVFGPFHVFALISLASVFVGFIPAYRKKRGWLNSHYKWMCWSYVSLLAATAAEFGVHLFPTMPPLMRLFCIFIAPPLVILTGRYFLKKNQERTIGKVVLEGEARV